MSKRKPEVKTAKAVKVMAEDPIAIAVPASIGILGDSFAKVGPCWGPEFEPLLATKRGYEKQDNPKLIAW